MSRDREKFEHGDVILQSGTVLPDARLACKTCGDPANAASGAVLLTGHLKIDRLHLGRGMVVAGCHAYRRAATHMTCGPNNRSAMHATRQGIATLRPGAAEPVLAALAVA